MQVEAFFDGATSTLSYVVWDPESRDAVVIDPLWDYDPRAVALGTGSLERLASFIDAESLQVHWSLETHIHADHLSGGQWIRKRYDAGVVIGEHVTEVQRDFAAIFELESFPCDGSQFDRLVRDGEVLEAGSLSIGVIHTPGHTPACVSYKIEDAVFAGDSMFMPDFGTGRCDFPGGSARQLYRSVCNKLFALPPATRVFVGHDYQPGGRELIYETTVAGSKEANKHLCGTTREDEFVRLRSSRDATLELPELLYQSVQVNIRGGRLPVPGPSGTRYLKLPLNLVEGC